MTGPGKTSNLPAMQSTDRPAANELHLSRELARQYLDVLAGHKLGEIFQEVPRLSGLFLGGVPAGIGRAAHRVMVVGMETRQWRDENCPFKAGKAPTTTSIAEAMAVQARVLAGAPGRFRFLQFARQVSHAAAREVATGGVAVVWGNLFCVSHAGGSPVGVATFQKIQALSIELLRTQIEVVQPDAILFTTGADYDRHLRACFPERTDSERIAPRRLWRFRVGETLCYRTSHPRYAAHNSWRDRAIADVFSALNGKRKAQSVYREGDDT